MRDIEKIVKDVAMIYRKSGREAEQYLDKTRALRKVFGPGLAIVYCWFYSVPQKWTQVEPKIFKLMKNTKSFDLDILLSMPLSSIISILRPMIFYNEISSQLRNFCLAIKSEYSSWGQFAEALKRGSMFTLFESMRYYKNTRFTFKNLAAMKIFVGMDDDLLILDTHVARVLGINRHDRRRYKVQMTLFEDLLNFSRIITDALRNKGYNEINMVKWSLSIWFHETKISANDLLKEIVL